MDLQTLIWFRNDQLGKLGMITMVMDAQTALCISHDRYVKQGKVKNGPSETEGGGASVRQTQEILLNKSSSVSFYNPAPYYQYVAAKCSN